MTQMGFNLDKLKDVVKEGELSTHPELVNLLQSKKEPISDISQLGVSSKKAEKIKAEKSRAEKTLSCKEIERDRGKPLSKFDRNVMIFDWLHTLDETATIDLT